MDQRLAGPRPIIRMLSLMGCLLLASAANLHAQVPDSCKLRIGTNLAGPADWGAEWPFVDIMKFARTWITHNDHWVGGGQNAWDTGVLDSIPLDEEGYPMRLPVSVAGQEAPQIVRTVWAGTQHLPGGVYTVLYDGIGQLGFWGDAEVLTSEPGRMTIQIFPGRDSIFAMELESSDAFDHLRNIRILMPGTASTFHTDPFSKAWLEKLEPFQTLRFMDWGHTNSSHLEQWEDRPLPQDYTYTRDGIPYEWMIRLCNLKKSDAWVCVPHRADDEYIRNMARLFRDSLDPALKIQVEYSNEIWNWIFDQAHYCLQSGDTSVAWPERVVPFIQNALDIWTGEFAGQEDRLVRVVGVQASWQDVSNRIVFNMRPGSFDAFSPAAYFGFTSAGISELETLGNQATGADVIRLAREGLKSSMSDWIRSQYESITIPLGIPMIYYEGGQHLTPQPFGSIQPYNPALVEAQTHPLMYDLYQELLDSLRQFTSGEPPALFMNFSFISPPSGRYGTWGVLGSQFYQQPPFRDSAPKYQALLDNMFDCSPATALRDPITERSVRVFPNPWSGGKLVLESDAPVHQVVWTDLAGRQIAIRKFRGEHSLQLDPPRSGSGFRLLMVFTEEGLVRKKVLFMD